MADLWQDEGFGDGGGVDELDENDWDEGDESLESTLEDGFDDPAVLDDQLDDLDED